MKLSHSFILSTIIAFVAIFFLYNVATHTQTKLMPAGEPMSIGSADDADARYNYELMRLRDPATGRIPDHIRELELAFARTIPNDAMFASQNFKTAGATWNQRGPYNVGGRTRALAIDVTDENIILAGTNSGGLWRSTNGGTSWTQTSDISQLQNVSCIAQDIRPGKTNTWYYGSGEGTGASASAGGAYFLGNGLYKSTNGGITWSPLTSTNSNTPHTFEKFFDVVWNVACNPADTVNNTVYAATIGVIYKSIDGGTTWTIAKGGGSTYSYYADVLVTPKKGVVYATLDSQGPDKGIWRSEDGVTFTNITPAGFPTKYNRIVIGNAPSDENQVYFLGSTPGFGTPDTNFQGSVEWNSLWKYTYVSGDGTGSGGIWEDRSANLPKTGRPFNTFNAQGGYDLVVKVKPDDANTVFIGGTNLFRSTDGFSTSGNTTYIGGYELGAKLPVVNMYKNHHPDQHQLLFYNSDPKKMLCGNDGGVFKTTDNTADTISWTSLNNGYVTSMFYTCAIDHATSGNNVIVAGAQDNGSWFTNNANPLTPWVTPRGGDGSYCAIADGRTAYYLSIQNGKMMKADLDANGNVLSRARIDPRGGKGYQFINPYVIDPNNNNIMYLAGGKQLWRNDDLSGIPMVNNWDSITTNWVAFPDTVPTALSKITAVAVCKTPANRVYYGCDKRRLYRIDNANVGTPSPIDVTGVSGTNSFPGSGYISCIAIDPTDGNKVMVVFSNYGLYSLFYTTDGGTNWTKVGGNLESNSSGTGAGPSCRWASILPVSDGTVYLVATSTGLYSTDTLKGTSTVWVQQGASTIGNLVCDMIDTRLSDGLVVVATHGNGIFSANITSKQSIVTVKDIEAKTTNYELKNYPNPATAQTTIEFTLPGRSNVSLTLYDELGKEITKISSAEYPAGHHSVPLNTDKLPAGIYYYSLGVGQERVTKKLVKAN